MKKKEIKRFNKKRKKKYKSRLTKVIRNFDSYKGGEGDRNIIKVIPIKDVEYNVKAFKIPNIINQIAYRFFRKSKAERSFEYAKKLIDLEIRTPKPVAYFEYKSSFLFKKSFYVSKQINYDLTYRELLHDFNYPDYENILRAFTRFTYNLHEKDIHFLDHSPGNTLIKKKGEKYRFYLVDLNRMRFGPMDFNTRIQNFSRLTKHKHMVEIMSDEYAKCLSVSYDSVFEPMWNAVQVFQTKIKRKRRLKQKFKV